MSRLIHKNCAIFYLLCHTIKKQEICGFFLTFALSIQKAVRCCPKVTYYMDNDNAILGFINCFFLMRSINLTCIEFADGYNQDIYQLEDGLCKCRVFFFVCQIPLSNSSNSYVTRILFFKVKDENNIIMKILVLVCFDYINRCNLFYPGESVIKLRYSLNE